MGLGSRLVYVCGPVDAAFYMVTGDWEPGEGIIVLVGSLLVWSITQSSKPNQRTNDATC